MLLGCCQAPVGIAVDSRWTQLVCACALLGMSGWSEYEKCKHVRISSKQATLLHAHLQAGQLCGEWATAIADLGALRMDDLKRDDTSEFSFLTVYRQQNFTLRRQLGHLTWQCCFRAARRVDSRPMAGRLALKGHLGPFEILGISSGYMQNFPCPFFIFILCSVTFSRKMERISSQSSCWACNALHEMHCT